jgi:hypothetical protein
MEIIYVKSTTSTPSPSSPPLSPNIELTPGNESFKNRMTKDETPTKTEPLPPANLFPTNYKPLITIEESIIKAGFTDSLLSWCKNRAQKILESTTIPHKQYGMTKDDVLAILAYTFDLGLGGNYEDNLYFQLNQTLRTRNPQELMKWRDFIWYFLNSLSKLPKYTGKVARGLNIQIPKDKYQKTNNVVWNAFSSCSKSNHVAKNFVQGKGTLFILDVIDGVLISEFSCIPSEDEVLLNHC